MFFKDGYPVGFNMNTVCAAVRGRSWTTKREAGHSHRGVRRLGTALEDAGQDSGRAGVFAESDLIHKQQMGYRKGGPHCGVVLGFGGQLHNKCGQGTEDQAEGRFSGRGRRQRRYTQGSGRETGASTYRTPALQSDGAWCGSPCQRARPEDLSRPTALRESRASRCQVPGAGALSV